MQQDAEELGVWPRWKELKSLELMEHMLPAELQT